MCIKDTVYFGTVATETCWGRLCGGHLFKQTGNRRLNLPFTVWDALRDGASSQLSRDSIQMLWQLLMLALMVLALSMLVRVLCMFVPLLLVLLVLVLLILVPLVLLLRQ